ncbi:heparinase II/III family protein [Glutamicibacter creatinolyticus]|uniref:heparinase II/III domain-containing protein n=1 Tax=Glutamicibacter creatinolyticus TaxID=162496 RepID=UPI0033DFD82F
MSKFYKDTVQNLIEQVLITEVSATRKEEIGAFFESSGRQIPTNYGLKQDTDTELWGSRSDRTTERYFHGFLFMQGWAHYLRQSGSELAAARVFEYARRWETLYPMDAWKDSGMAYHDETTAQRLITLLGLLTAVRPLRNEFAEALADRTADLLRSEEFHSGLNNHGMFQDLALRNYALSASWTSEVRRAEAWNISVRRLREYFLHAYTREGVHVENTPTYHLMVSKHLQQHVEVLNTVDMAESVELKSLLNNASRYATHVTLPNGQFPPISDTTIQSLENNAGSVFDEQFSYAVTQGRFGQKPKHKSMLFRNSGYGIYRSDWEDPGATYLLFQAAYNDNYHKHSDDLSLILYAKNRILITEAGPFGYNYADPFTKYAYGQFAHNNIVVNGLSTPRTDDKASTVKISTANVSEGNFDITASTGRLKDCLHERRVKVDNDARRETIEVIDKLESNQRQNYSMHWQIPENYELIVHKNGFEVYDNSIKLFDAVIESDAPASLSVQAGVVKPRIIGWSFPKFGSKTKLKCVVISFVGEGRTNVKTTFNLHDYTFEPRKELKDPVYSETLSETIPAIGEINTWFDNVSGRLFASTSMIEGTEVAYRLYRDNILVNNVGYSTSNYHSWRSLTPGIYRVRFFRRYIDGADSAKITGARIRVQ